MSVAILIARRMTERKKTAKPTSVFVGAPGGGREAEPFPNNGTVRDLQTQCPEGPALSRAEGFGEGRPQTASSPLRRY
jgi:hypothetical protein